MQPAPKAAFDRLIGAAVLACPHCGGGLRRTPAGAVCAAGHEAAFTHGVLDLYAPERHAEEPAARPEAEAEVAAAFAEQLGLDAADVLAANLLEPLPKTGNVHFDAEEDLFVERFGFANVRPKLEILKVYGGRRMAASDVHAVAVRVRNAGLFPISSLGGRPLLLAYHWMDAEDRVTHFEGRRSGLPVDVAPGQAVTAHLLVEAPRAAGPMRLKILPVQEGVAWLEEDGTTIDVEIVDAPPPEPARADAGRPFAEALDNELADAFMDQRLRALPEPLLAIEIGGATSAALSEWALRSGRAATIVNADISVRLLRVAALLAEKRGDGATVQARLAAERLPFRGAAADAIVFRRSLHHFDDPVAVLRECARVLKPSGLIFLLCEPVAAVYDDETRALIRAGVNEQVFPLDGWQAMFLEAGLEAVDMSCDWGFSLKAALRRRG